MKKRILVFTGLFSILLGFLLQYGDTLEKEKYLNQMVRVSRDTGIYSKNLKKVGEVSEGVILSLGEDEKSNYYQIEGTDYYIYYEDIKQEDSFQTPEKEYLTFNQNVHTSSGTSLKQDGEEKITLKEEVNLPVEYMDEEYYYVNFLGDQYQIKKSDGKLEERENSKEEEVSLIPVIHFTTVTEKQLQEFLSYLKGENYQSISLDEYSDWLDGKIRLSKKSILLTTDHKVPDTILKDFSFNIENISSNSIFHFIDTNSPTDRDTILEAVSRYVVSSDVTFETFQKMVAGNFLEDQNSNEEQEISVLNYHFFYDEVSETCEESICLDVKKFEEQLLYLKKNGYRTLTMKEFYQWMKKEIELPRKSVLITIDDGAMGTGKNNGNKLIPLLEKYKIHATLFLITGWWDKKDYTSTYLEIESHGNDLHLVGDCGKNQIYCLTKDQLREDLEESKKKLDTNFAFCYPFYSYSDTLIEVLKEADYKLAFTGGGRRASRKDDFYKIPRFPIQKEVTIEQFAQMIS